MAPLIFRLMLASDASSVGALHAASWRSAYRGILSDDYLAGDVELDRAVVWKRRFDTPDETRFGVMAELGGVPVGFVYVIASADVVWGNLVDNLHVSPEARSAGIGPQLLARAAGEIEERGWDRRMHLWVYDANTRARAFYARIGGREVESIIEKDTPDSGVAKSWRVAWPDVSALLPDG